MEAVGCQPPESSTGSSPSPSLSEENTGNASQSKGLNSWRAPYRLSAPLAYLDDFSAQFSVPPPGYSPYHNFIRRDFTWGGAQTPSFDPTLRTDLHSVIYLSFLNVERFSLLKYPFVVVYFQVHDYCSRILQRNRRRVTLEF